VIRVIARRQRSLFLQDRIAEAIDRIQRFEPEEGYYLCNSGGKDSAVLEALAKMAGVKYESHFHRTTVDPPEVIRYLKSNHPNVILDKPPASMFKLIIKNGIPPLRNKRYCCRVLKESYGVGRVVLAGTRRQESVSRRDRQLVWFCPSKAKVVVNAILDWTTTEVWDFIYKYDLPYCSLYDEGFERIGCILCPCGSKRNRLREVERFPRFYRAYIRCFDKMIERRLQMGKNTTWKTGEEVMDWWLDR
jgi:phosphoadenosine phosphosulfate reductase